MATTHEPGAGHDLDFSWTDAVVVAGNEDGSDGAAVSAPACDSRRFLGKMPVAPLHQCEHRNCELATLLGQSILEARRALAVSGSLHDAFADEAVEAISEDVRRHAEARLELVEAAHAEEGVPDDQ
jgi:hypothetical protein